MVDLKDSLFEIANLFSLLFLLFANEALKAIFMADSIISFGFLSLRCRFCRQRMTDHIIAANWNLDPSGMNISYVRKLAGFLSIEVGRASNVVYNYTPGKEKKREKIPPSSSIFHAWLSRRRERQKNSA